MLHALALLGAGLGLAALTWRLSGGVGARVPMWLALPWTLWVAEAGLTVMTPAAGPAPQKISGRPVIKWGPRFTGADGVRALDDRPRVAVIGDSFVAGLGVDEAHTLPMQMAERLGALGVDADVRNLGDAGRSFFDEYIAYDALAGAMHPDVVVWVFVLNDLGFRGGNDFDLINLAPPPAPSGLALIDVVQRARWARDTTARTTEGYQQALAEGEPGLVEVRRLLGAVADELRARGGRLIFTVYPLMHDLDAYPFDAEHDRLDAIAKAAGAEVVDLRPVFRGRDEDTLWANVLDHHPNAIAHGLAADVLAQALVAAPIAPTGPVDCAVLPPIAGLDGTLPAACAGGPPEQVALAAALRTLDLHAPFIPMYTPSLASDLAARAGLLSEQSGDAATAEAARALLQQLMDGKR